MAHLPQTLEQFSKKAFVFSLYLGIGGAALAFFFFSRSIKVKAAVLPLMLAAFSLFFLFSLAFMLQVPKGSIRRREREINREVLFAGRYLLVKIESGYPLFNSLIDAARMKNRIAKYFKEIVDEINTGTPIEAALEGAREYNASQKFKKILWQILSSLKTGTEVAGSLRSILKNIANEELVEIKGYGKKLNSYMLFYMVLACIVPSLGISLFIIIASFLGLAVVTAHFIIVLIGIFFVQLFFIIMIKASRPDVDL